MKTRSTKYYAVIHTFIGLALINTVNSWNDDGVINWGTVCVSFVGVALIISGIVDFLSSNKR